MSTIKEPHRLPGKEAEEGSEAAVNRGRRRALAAMGAAGASLVMGGLMFRNASAQNVSEAVYGSGGGTVLGDEYPPVDIKGLYNVYSVKEYGAVGDGATNDGPAIQKAIDDAFAAGGGIVFFPAGAKYAISTPLVVKNNVTVASGRQKASIKLMTGYSSTYAFGLVGRTRAALCNLSIDCNYAQLSQGVYITSGTDILLERVEIRNCTRQSSGLIRIVGGTDIKLKECVLENGYIGMDIRGNVTRLLIDRCDISRTNQTAIRVTGDATTHTEYTTIQHCKIHSVGELPTDIAYPIYYTCGGNAQSASKHRYVRVLYNEIIGNKKAFRDGGNADMIAVYDVEDGIVQGNVVLYGGDVGISTDRSRKMIISDNIAAYCHTVGIGIYQSDDITVVGNEVYNNYQNYDGTLNPMPRGGIRLTARAGNVSENVVITGNRCYDSQETKTQDYGIYADSRSRNVDIGENTLTGNKFGMIRTATVDDVSFSFTVTRADVPTTGYWEKGMIVRSRNIAPGSVLQWVCVESGTPGVWHPVQLGVSSSIGDPPAYVGQIAIVDKKCYIATGTETAKDWNKMA